MFGVTTSARGSSSARIARTPSSSSSASPLLAIITGSTTTIGRSSSSIAAPTASTIAAVAEHAGLRGVELDVAGDRFDLRRDEIGGERPTTAVTPTVFCAVIAVMALVP